MTHWRARVRPVACEILVAAALDASRAFASASQVTRPWQPVYVRDVMIDLSTDGSEPTFTSPGSAAMRCA